MATYILVNIVCLPPPTLREVNVETVKALLEKVFKEKAGSIFESIQLNVSQQPKSIKDDRGFFEFEDCEIHLRKLETSWVRQLLINLCGTPEGDRDHGNDDFGGIYLNLGKEEIELPFLTSLNQKPCHSIRVKSFGMGTIVRLSSFISHIDSLNEIGDSAIMNHETMAKFEHDKHILSVYFRIETRETRHSRFSSINYKMIIRYQNIRSIVFSPNKKLMYAYFVLECPPLLHFSLDDNYNALMDLKQVVHVDSKLSSDYWIRVTDCPGMNKEVIGKCNVLKLVFPQVVNADKIPPHEVVDCPWSLIKSLPYFKSIPIHFAFVKEHKSVNAKDLQIVFRNSNLDDIKRFEIVYAVDVIQSLSFQLVDEIRHLNLVTQFGKMITQFAETNADVLKDVLYLVYDAIQKTQFIRIFESIKRLFNLRSEIGKIDLKLSKSMVEMRRIAVTPHRVLLLPPVPAKQSILVHAPPEGSSENSTIYRAEYCLRGLFRNDDMTKLHSSIVRIVDYELSELKSKHRKTPEERKRLDKLERRENLANDLQMKFLRDCMVSRLINGLKIQDRLYEYYGSSSSQLKEFGMILYAKDCYGHTAKDIRGLIGNITEKNVSKYVARVGLSISEVMEFVDVSDAEIIDDYPDIKTDDGKYTFSDGVGMISACLMNEIYEKLKDSRVMNGLDEPPSAIQIRIGGCKGMLVINPKLKGKRILIRQSMRKYKSENMALLGVLKTSNVRSFRLNRPLITLLDQLKSDRNYLFELLNENLQELTDSLTDEDRAKNILLNNSSLNQDINLSMLVVSGITLLSEPFFRSCIEAIMQNSIRQLREKARVKISREHGRTMFGVLDETMTLQQGQVFVRYSDDKERSRKHVVTGKVMVTKFPCMHPGDIRILEAVDVKDLHYVKDCIVFPAQGSRPHPDEMGGSDLDGDEYAVVWDKRIFPQRTHEPMDYLPGVAEVVDEVTVQHILDFFVKYVTDYSVGRIANAHLAWADVLANGVFSEKCRQLAEKHAISLDFPKTGINETLDRTETIHIWPDFMEKQSIKGYYLSQRLLGYFYRKVRFVEIGLDEHLLVDTGKHYNEFLNHNEWPIYRDVAEKAYRKYVRLMQRLQSLLHISSEAAVIFGFTDKVTSCHVDSEQAKDMGYKVREMVKNIFEEMRNDFEEEFNDMDEVKARRLKLAKASAYYTVTYLNSDSQKFYGLPWIFSEYLAELSMQKGGDRKEYNLVQFFVQTINERFGEVFMYDEVITNAKMLLNSWLTKQRQFGFSVRISKQLLETELAEVFELNTVMMQIDSNTFQTSVGEITFNVLRHFAKHVLISSPNYASDKKELTKTALGMASLTTLIRIYKSRSIRCLFKEQTPNPLFRQYFISFGRNQELKDFVARNDEEFRTAVKHLSCVDTVYGRWINSSSNTFHYYLTAFGSKFALETLNLVIACLIHKKLDYSTFRI